MPNETLRAFLVARRKVILQQISDLRKELADIKSAEKAIAPEVPPVKERTRWGGGITIKTMIQEVLKDYPDGANAHTIINLVKEKFGKEISRPSMSPQLSRLKDAKVLLVEDGVWRLAGTQEPKSETSNADTLDVSDYIKRELAERGL